MKILLWSISPFVKTAYGIQSSQLARLFKELGHDVSLLCYSGFQGKASFDGIPITGVEDNGLSIVSNLMSETDFTLAFFDIWTLPMGAADQFKDAAIYSPVDHSPLSYRLRFFFNKAKACLSMTRFHQKECGLHGIVSTYIPHWVDDRFFKPMDKRKCRELFGFDQDCFLLGINAANVGLRKNFEGMISGFAMARDGWNIKLALNTYLVRDYTHPSGIDIISLLDYYGLKEGVDWYCTPAEHYLRGMPNEEMAAWYNALDCLLLCSLGEGFGIPVAEAALCKVPSIVSDFAAAPEVMGPGGLCVTAEGLVYFPLNKTLLRRPEVSDIAEAICKVGVDDKYFGEQAYQWAKGNYTVEAVKPLWDSFLKEWR